MLYSLDIFLRELATILKVIGSKSPNGSSKSKNSGFEIKIKASITLTSWPPDNSYDFLYKISKGKSSNSKISFTASLVAVSGNLGNKSSKISGIKPILAKRSLASLSGKSIKA